MTFTDLSAHPTLQRALSERGYVEPTPVQAAVLAEGNAERDLLVSAATGSGKTVAFGLALARTLLGEAERLPPTKKPLALVVAPTRELALQVQRELTWLYAPAGGRVGACVGGMEIRREQRALAEGLHLVVGTPGRLCDHLERKSLVLSALRAVVLDEADEMLDMGFREDLERILDAAPEERRTLLFSATLPRPIVQLAERYQREAVRIAATKPTEAHPDIAYRAHPIATREREHAVVNVLRAADAPAAIVFCATRDAVTHLNASLVERGFLSVALSGELSQAERNRALKALRDGRARILVATDVAARGLDLPQVGLVIHADLPNDSQVLQHRSGRTGRAGRKGVSVLLVPSSSRRTAERLLREAKIAAEWSPVPAAESIRKLDQDRMVEEITGGTEPATEDDLAVARLLLEKRSAEELVAVLVTQHRSRLPAPEELPLTAQLGTAVRPTARPTAAAKPSGTRPTAIASATGAERRPPAPRPASVAWFKVNVGRDAGADPRWLLPLICRRGKVTKEEIGAIRILQNETRFEIAAHAATRFSSAASQPDRKEPAIRIAPAPPPSSEVPTAPAARPARRPPRTETRAASPTPRDTVPSREPRGTTREPKSAAHETKAPPRSRFGTGRAATPATPPTGTRHRATFRSRPKDR